MWGRNSMTNWKKVTCDGFRPSGLHHTKFVLLVGLHVSTRERGAGNFRFYFYLVELICSRNFVQKYLNPLLDVIVD